MPTPPRTKRLSRWLVLGGTTLGFIAGVALLMLWLMGAFKPKVTSDGHAGTRDRTVPKDAPIVQVARVTRPLLESASGTIQPVHRVEVASRILARTTAVDAIAGMKVSVGQVLVRLDDADLKLRLAQAKSAVEEARSSLNQAGSEESRLQAAFDRGAIADLDMERARNAKKSAEAALTRATDAEQEATTVLGYATITSPIEGVIVDKRVNLGDTVAPGQVVVTLLDPTRMQLVASVRESLTSNLSVGGSVTVAIDALGHSCSGLVSEIVPESDETSRTFQVKVTGPCPDGIHAGMFGRLLIPVGEETVLMIPRTAVRSVGQLDLVDAIVNERVERRAVRLGRTFDESVEVLAGLREGDAVLAHPTEGN